MNCYCVEKNDKFIYFVENVENEYKNNMEIAGFIHEGDKYIKEYKNNFDDKEIIKINFQKIGKSLFKKEGNWEKSLEIFAERCFKANIEWIMVGSICEAVYGINIIPHDIDIVVYVKDFYNLKTLFMDYIIDPFIDNGGNWVFQYFGRLCIDGILIEIAADNRDVNKEFYIYENIKWKNYELKIKPIKKRYEIEIQRNRVERIEKIKEYMIKNNIN